MPEPDIKDDDLPTAQRLGESFAALIGGKEWELDTPELLPEVEELLPLPAPPPPVVPIVRVPEPVAPTPVAEAANEPNVPPSPLQIIEALLFVGGHALRFEETVDAIRGLSIEQFRESMDTLNRVYKAQHRPYEIVHHADGYVLRVTGRHSAIREKLFGGPREARLNPSALDVLSLIAYRQPVGKGEIDAIRGADSAGVMRQLVRLGLIAIIHRDDTDPKNAYYGTTSRFLEIFRLKDIDDLPKLGEPKKLP